MQGKKDYQEKLFTHFQLNDRVPKENFYRFSEGVQVIDSAFVKPTAVYPIQRSIIGQERQKKKHWPTILLLLRPIVTSCAPMNFTVI